MGSQRVGHNWATELKGVKMQTERTDLWTQWGKERRDEQRKQRWNMCITTCKTDSQWEFSLWLREQRPVLCDNLAGWEVGGRFKGKGGRTYTHGWFMLMCGKKSIQYCKAIILQLKINLKKIHQERSHQEGVTWAKTWKKKEKKPRKWGGMKSLPGRGKCPNGGSCLICYRKSKKVGAELGQGAIQKQTKKRN